MLDFVRAKKLLKRVASNEASDEELDELYEAFYYGFDLNHLRELLNSDQPEVVRNASYILSELRGKACPLLDECHRLLENHDSWVKSNALDVILINAERKDAELLAHAMTLIDDDQQGVAWRVLDFLYRLDSSRLAASLLSPRVEHLSSFIKLLLLQSDKALSEQIDSWVQSEERLRRWFGVVAAARNGAQSARLLGILANPSGDAAERFAADILERQTLAAKEKNQN